MHPPDPIRAGLAVRRGWFGHQSVGDDLLEGVRAFADTPRLARGERVPRGSVGHAALERNGAPHEKIEGFVDAVRAMNGAVDVVAMKLCWADFDDATDASVDELAKHYVAAVSTVEAEFPDLRVLHVTTPLRTVQGGVRAVVKRVIGRPLGGISHNALRERYNRALRRFPLETVFDLARLEWTRRDGSEERHDGVPALAPEYTHDGGHLDAQARRDLGAQLARRFAAVPLRTRRVA